MIHDAEAIITGSFSRSAAEKKVTAERLRKSVESFTALIVWMNLPVIERFLREPSNT